MSRLKHLLRYSAPPAAAALTLSDFMHDSRSRQTRNHTTKHDASRTSRTIANTYSYQYHTKTVLCEANTNINANTNTNTNPNNISKISDSIHKPVEGSKSPANETTLPPAPEPVTTPNPDNTDPSADAQPQPQPQPEPEVLFHGLFPLRQLYKPKVEYPLWDTNWDNKKPASTGDRKQDQKNHRFVRKNGITRHIILIRHGQYDETHKEDHLRVLTPLGRTQAELTGKRLAQMIKGINSQSQNETLGPGPGPCNVKIIRVSDMARAKETADIIAAQIPSVERADPDPLLNEGRPCHTIPGGRVTSNTIQKTEEGNQRIERAFEKYFYRADAPELPKEEMDEDVGAGPEPEAKAEAKEKVDGNIEKGDPQQQLNLNVNEKGNPLAAVENKDRDKDRDRDSTNNDAKESVDDDSKPKNHIHPQHEFEIIVCHANVIRYFMCRALQLPPEAWLRMCTFNCSLNYITIRPTGSVSVRMLGDIGHLGYEHSTFSMHHGYNW